MKHPLNFNWFFIANFNDEYIRKTPANSPLVDLPHNMVDFPFIYFDEKIFETYGTYIKEITINEVTKDRLYILRFEGVNNAFDLYVNEAHVGQFTRPYIEENINISEFVKEGHNRIVVKVNGTHAVNAPPFGNTVDFFPFSGIYREVSLLIYDSLALLDLKIDARSDGKVTLKPKIRNINNENYTIKYEVYQDNKEITSSFDDEFTVFQPRLWSINDPYLYNLRVILKGEKETYYYGFTFGFRDIEFKELGFYLNNIKTPLVGLNRHETFPYLGGAATAYLQFSDVVALKKLGVNYVRCSHYPPSRHFLDACDYLGLLVINEVPGWQYIGDEAWQKIHLQNIETMINRDYNHPSIIAWSIRINESPDHKVYEKGQTLAKKLDPYRPTTGTRNFAHSNDLEDIYSYNDFSHDGTNKGLVAKKKITKSKKPYIVSENNGHMYPTKPFDNPLILESHAKRHLKVLDAFFKDSLVVGISPWCMHDYYTHKEFGSGDKICYHGVQDIFRNNKPAAYVYQSNFTDIPTLYPLFKGDNGDLPESRLYKTIVLSNAKYVDLFKDDTLIKRYYPRSDLYPYLPNAPYVIDTFIGENFISDKNFSKKDRKKIAKLLNYAAVNNFDRLTLSMKLSLLRLIIKYKMGRADLVDLWSKNIAGWGDKSNGYTLVGYNENDQEMVRTRLGMTTSTNYEIVISKDELRNGETYDMTTVHIDALSPYRNHYDFSPVKITTSGPIKLCGPELQTLHAGSLVLYFKSIKESGSATITISVNNTTKTLNVKIL